MRMQSVKLFMAEAGMADAACSLGKTMQNQITSYHI
jgi:hypothetical protein